MATTGSVTASLAGPATTDGPGRADVELRVPADGAFASVIRTTTAGLAARLDFTIDEIADLRIAVGEAHALALDHASPAGDLTCGFALSPGRMTVVISAPVDAPPEIDRESFAWQVLTTLATTADLEVVEGALRVSMTMQSATHVQPAADAAPDVEGDGDAGPSAG